MLKTIQRAFAFIFLIATATSLALPALALTSDRLFTYKHWTVDYVVFDNGTVACEASVGSNDLSLSIWTYADRSVKIQFYDVDEWFGQETSYRDISVKIDSRSPWDVTDAEFRQNSIFFSLPSDNWDVSERFINEIKRGWKLRLYNQFGDEKSWYSLSGSSAAIGKLGECQNRLRGGSGW